MAARKPNSLSARHNTKDENEQRENAEALVIPKTLLTKHPPRQLVGEKGAAKVWTRIMSLYQEIEGTIVTAFDEDLLVKYCLLEQECTGMAGLRDGVLESYRDVEKQLGKIKPKTETLKIYLALLEQKNDLLARYQGLDARLDGKRKLLHTLSQSMYLTPRSRAGVAPTGKKPDEPKTELEEMM